MGAPRFVPAALPFEAETDLPAVHALEVGGESLEIGVVSMGNPMRCCWSTASTRHRYERSVR